MKFLIDKVQRNSFYLKASTIEVALTLNYFRDNHIMLFSQYKLCFVKATLSINKLRTNNQLLISF